MSTGLFGHPLSSLQEIATITTGLVELFFHVNVWVVYFAPYVVKTFPFRFENPTFAGAKGGTLLLLVKKMTVLATVHLCSALKCLHKDAQLLRLNGSARYTAFGPRPAIPVHLFFHRLLHYGFKPLPESI